MNRFASTRPKAADISVGEKVDNVHDHTVGRSDIGSNSRTRVRVRPVHSIYWYTLADDVHRKSSLTLKSSSSR
jgi:hypothetical protein